MDSDILFCFESPTGWVRGTVSKDVRRQKNQYNFCVLWDDGEVQNLFLRPAKYTTEGHEPASWFVISSQIINRLICQCVECEVNILKMILVDVWWQ